MKRKGESPPRTRLDRLRRYAASRRALFENAIADYAAGINYETPEFLRLDDEAAEAERGVPRWLCVLIDRRIVRELDYWNRTGQ